MRAVTESDREDARRYLEQITFGRANPELLEQRIAQVPALLSFLAEHGLEFDVINAFPDYEAEMEGGRAGGRSVEPRLFATAALGDLASALRPDPRPPFRQCEYFEEWKSVRNMPLAQLAQRAKDGIVARGQAMIAPLVAALGRLGATLVVECPGERLLTEAGRISEFARAAVSSTLGQAWCWQRAALNGTTRWSSDSSQTQD